MLREGVELHEGCLVNILEGDKEWFLSTERSLIQTIDRAARNAEGQVILYADSVTPSMESALRETQRRREIQIKYNEEHGIVPKTIVKRFLMFLKFLQREKLPRRSLVSFQRLKNKNLFTSLKRR